MAPAFEQKIDSIKLDAKSVRYHYPKLKLLPLKMVQSDEAREKALYSGRGRALLRAQKFEEIERVARELQRSNATDVSGKPYLDAFFSGVSAVEDEGSV